MTALFWRVAALLAFWLVLFGTEPADLPAGLGAAVVAAWVSLHLRSRGSLRASIPALARLALHFFRQSVVAGADVAWRALDPRLPLKPGFVHYPVRLSPGTPRNVFTTLTSLLPGTVPAAEENGELVYHCLDIDQPVAAELAAEEAALAQALRDD